MTPANIVWANLLRRYEVEIKNLFTGVPMDKDSLEHLASTEWFKKSAWGIAERMVGGAVNGNKKSWQEAAFKSKRSKEIHQALKRELYQTPIGNAVNKAIAENAKLISSLPLDIAEYITKFAESQYAKGGRTGEIEEQIRKQAPYLAKSRVQLIARTEISKVETDLTKARSEEMGIDWYVWMSATDQRTRESHKRMHNVLVSWNDPPSPEVLTGMKSEGKYHAGQIYNCRCIALPIVDESEVVWPHKAYRNNIISMMSIAEFRKLNKIAA